MLAAEGLVTVVANSGAWVARLTMEECAEAYLVRERLEPMLLRMSLPALDDAAVARMGELAAEMEAAAGSRGTPDVDAFLRADREFHLSSYTGAARGETWQITRRLWNATQHYRREFTRLAALGGPGGANPGGAPRTPGGASGADPGAGGLAVTHVEHRLLLDCIRRHDPDDCERVLVTHIRRTRLELLRHPEVFL
jgi:DNA-binding GntR family transcriptional regulator